MFKLISFLPAGITLILIIFVVIWLSNRQRLAMTLLTILGIIFLISLGSPLFKGLRDPFKPITSTALFKEIEYVQHLQLVSHYSEEIILLGTTERVKQIVESRKADVAQQKNAVAGLEDSIAHMVKQIEETSASLADGQAEWKARDELWKTNNERYQQLLKKGLKPSKEKDGIRRFAIPDQEARGIVDGILASEKPTIVDTLLRVFLDKRRKWDSLCQEFDNKPWGNISIWKKKKRREVKNRLKIQRDSVKEEMTAPFDLLTARLDRELEAEWTGIKDSLLGNRGLKSEQKAATEEWSDKLSIYRKEHKKAQNKLRTLEDKLSEAEAELIFAEANGTAEEPELLVILPAEVAVYIDLAEIRINEDSLESKTLIVVLPEIQVDSVLIDLPEDSAVYQMDRKKIELTKTRDGAYYDLFGQLKEAITELQGSVRAKALDKGILKEGEKMAEEYLRTLVKPMGYQIRFKKRESIDV